MQSHCSERTKEQRQQEVNYEPDEKDSRMARHRVTLLKPYPLEVGQKIHIESGPRRGDWRVVGVTERKVKLQCPVSNREFEWDRFCYVTDERTDREWPQQ